MGYPGPGTHWTWICCRVVEAWMDQHRDYYYASNFVYEYKRISLDEKDKNSLREHKALR